MVTYQAPRSMGFSRQEYWSGLPFPSPGDLPNPGIEPGSPALQTDALPSEPLGKPKDVVYICNEILLSHEKEWNLAFCNIQHGWTVRIICWLKKVGRWKKKIIWYDIACIWNLKTKMKKKKPTQDSENKQIKEQKQTHRHREHIGGYQRGRGLREGRVEEVSKIWVKGVKCKVMDGS